MQKTEDEYSDVCAVSFLFHSTHNWIKMLFERVQKEHNGSGKKLISVLYFNILIF